MSEKLYIVLVVTALEIIEVLQGTEIPWNTGAFLGSGGFPCKNRQKGW